jgi:hypothetical protein
MKQNAVKRHSTPMTEQLFIFESGPFYRKTAAFISIRGSVERR